MTVPYTFAASSGSIPLSYLDSNFATTITMGNTAVQLGDTITTFNNVTLASPTITSASMSGVTISSGNVTATTITATTGTFSGNVQMASLNGGAISLRNKIINGSFTVNQRGITTVTPASGDYTVDRWTALATVASKYSISVNAAGSTGVAAGIFGSALTATTLVAYSVAATDTFNIQQKIEGYNIADLAWGTAAAKTITLSFYTQSSLTGTFGGAIRNSAATRSYPFTYSISVANTWTKISVTIPGDTTGAFADWLTTNGIGMSVIFSLGSGTNFSGTAGTWAAASYTSATGATSIIGTLSATLYLANVQLEVGPVATPFEQRLIGMELALCQRYFQKPAAPMSGGIETTTVASFNYSFPVSMRVAPTFTAAATSADVRVSGATTAGIAGTWGANVIGTEAAGFQFTRTAGTWTANIPAFLNQSTAIASLSAEL